MGINNNFVIIISGGSTTYLLSPVYLSEKFVFSVFLVKITIFHLTHGMSNNLL